MVAVPDGVGSIALMPGAPHRARKVSQSRIACAWLLRRRGLRGTMKFSHRERMRRSPPFSFSHSVKPSQVRIGREIIDCVTVYGLTRDGMPMREARSACSMSSNSTHISRSSWGQSCHTDFVTR